LPHKSWKFHGKLRSDGIKCSSSALQNSNWDIKKNRSCPIVNGNPTLAIHLVSIRFLLNLPKNGKNSFQLKTMPNQICNARNMVFINFRNTFGFVGLANVIQIELFSWLRVPIIYVQKMLGVFIRILLSVFSHEFHLLRHRVKNLAQNSYAGLLKIKILVCLFLNN
jgi:hypothetical protein